MVRQYYRSGDISRALPNCFPRSCDRQKTSGAGELALPPLVDGQRHAGEIQRRDNQQSLIGDRLAANEQAGHRVDRADVAENDGCLAGEGEHAGTLDIKHGGVTIVSNLARSYTISKGGSEKATLERLRAANARGQIDEESTTALSEAFRLLWQIRLEHQVAQVAEGIPPDDFVDPARLGPIARLGLKEAFKIVMHEQQSLAADLGVSA